MKTGDELRNKLYYISDNECIATQVFTLVAPGQQLRPFRRLNANPE